MRLFGCFSVKKFSCSCYFWILMFVTLLCMFGTITPVIADDNTENVTETINVDTKSVELQLSALKAKTNLTEAEQEEVKNYEEILSLVQKLREANKLYADVYAFINSEGQSVMQEDNPSFLSEDDILAQKDLTELKSLQLQYQSLMDQATKKVHNLESMIEKVTALPIDTSDIIAKYTDKLLANKNRLNNSDTPLTSSLQTKLETENLYLQNQIEFRQFVLAKSNRLLEILNTQLQQQKKIVEQASKLVGVVEEHAQRVKAHIAVAEQQQVHEQQVHLAVKHPLLESLVHTNEATLKELEQSYTDTAKYTAINNELTALITRTQKLEADINTQIQYFKDTEFLSQILFNQQHIIPNYSMPVSINDQVTVLRMAQYRYSIELEQLTNPDLYIKNLLQTNNIASIDDDVRTDLLVLLENRKDLLTKLNSELTAELNVAVNAQINYQYYLKLKENLNNIIYNKMFWSPSNKAINIKWLKEMPTLVSQQINSMKQTYASLKFTEPTGVRLLWAVIAVFVFGILFSLTGKFNVLGLK